MSMEPEAGYLTHEELGGYETHETSQPQASGTDYQASEYSRSEESSGDDDVFIQEGRSSQKRRAESEAVEPILKRRKGLFNNNYLDLLNRDIEDAANRFAAGRQEDLPPSQIGLTVWTPFEKKLFFEAVSKLGKDNLQGISNRVRTKSEAEVCQYIALLQDAVERREQEQDGGLGPLDLADYPAAAEISQPCCHALDEAADALSFRQERHEELVEQKKWGDCWNINRELAKRIEGDHGLEKDHKFASEHGLAFTEVLRIKNWLQLPERIFMNASYAENNWQYVSEEPPTIRATALQDFHSLLVSITRKIVLTTLFMAESRIRAKKQVEPSTRSLVRRKDVEAAVASLGMKPDSNEFWATCARRLRLEVLHDETNSQNETDEEERLMPYDRVEKILRHKPDASEPVNEDKRSPTLENDSEHNESPKAEDEEGSESMGSDSESSMVLDHAEYEVREEAKEVLVYSAYDFPETHRTREALKNRIRNERAEEASAEAEDAKAAYEAELEMWRLLQRQPPEPLTKPDPVDRGRRAIKDVEDLYDVGRQWRKRLAYHNEWEMLGTPHLPDKES